MLDNILTDESSILIDVDTWKGSDEPEHKAMDFTDVLSHYKERTKKYNNLHMVIGMSEDYLPLVEKETIDFIYIDGNHEEEAVRIDAINGLTLLKNGAILAFDDYLWRGNNAGPKPAIDWFLEEYKNNLKILEHGYQVWVQKNDN
jgi:predicted O-methyltransferase YrrM